MKFYSVCIFLLMVMCDLSAQQTITINNAKPRVDIQGNIVDAHDGRVIQFGNKFYWYGTSYKNTNGFTTANEYVCYSSSNLSNWKFEGALLPQKPSGVYYRPHVVFNEKNNKYVLWYNWNPTLWNGQFGVAQSNSPIGPFTIINDNVQVKHSNLNVGDLGVFVDEDKKAYLSYNTIQGHKVSVELLDDNYTASTQQGSAFIAENCEAGSMFKRNGRYYLLTDYTCCFCTQGSGAQVFMANNPLGPFTYYQNINRHVGQLAAGLNDGTTNDNFYETLTAENRNSLRVVFKRGSAISKLVISQFTGDRNGQCGEVNNPITHQPIKTFTFNIEFFKNGIWKQIYVQPTITKTSQLNTYAYKIPDIVGVDELKITPLYLEGATTVHISEVVASGDVGSFAVYKNAQDFFGKPIIPAQQTYVMQLNTTNGTQYIWMGDLWGSASDNIKGHDYQFWSRPLQFTSYGKIKNISWVDEWSTTIK
jgi:hypothetical protein